MKCNVGGVDRLIRAAIGTLIAAAGIYYESLWGLLAVIPLVSAAISFCSLYEILKISTCKEHKAAR